MGLLDFLSGNSTGSDPNDPNAMGPPAPYQPNFFDRLGGMMGGVQQVDPTMAAQLGIDPAKLQHQLAMQALMKMGAGMATAGAPHNGHTPTIWEAMAGGMGAAQQGGQDSLQNMLKQAYMSKQTSVLAEQQKRQEAQNKANDALSRAISSGQLDPKFVLAMGMDEGSLRALATADSAKFTSMLTNWNSGNAAAARQDATDKTKQAHDDAMIAEQEKNANRRAAIAAAAQTALPKDLLLLPPELRQQAVMAKYGIQLGADGQPLPPMSKGELTKRDARVTELQDGITKAQAALDAIDAMKQNIDTGTYGQSGYGRAIRAGLPLPVMQGAGVVDMNKDAANLILAMQAAQASKGNRNSVLGLTTLKMGKPDPQAPDESNIHGLLSGRADIQKLYDNMTAEQEHYGQGGSPSTWAAAAAKLRAAPRGGDGGHQVGDIVTHGGKKYRVTGGDPNDPNVELVQ